MGFVAATFTHVAKSPAGDSDHSCRAVSIYGNDGTPSSMLAIPKTIIPPRLWLHVPPLASAPRPEVCVLDVVQELQVNVTL
jgi:hypothetical protein